MSVGFIRIVEATLNSKLNGVPSKHQHGTDHGRFLNLAQ